MNGRLRERHRELRALMQAQRWSEAATMAAALTQEFPAFAPGWLDAGVVALAQGRAADAVHAVEQAERLAAGNAVLLDAAGNLFYRAGDQRRALRAYDAAVAAAPGEAHFLYNRAAVRRFVGLLAEAEQDYDRVIALRPGDWEAWRNRSELRTQTAARNHVAALESLLASPPADWRGEVQLRFALAKELEDLGEYRRSFAELQRGAARRRAFLQYDVATDVATAGWIIGSFPGAVPAPATAPPPAAAARAPVFIVGLPRSGTTLVERIVSAHSAVSAGGELDHFARAIVAAAGRVAGRTQLPRRELVEASARIDFAALGADYLARVAAGGIGPGRFTDKMPLNYLYCGLIRRALPDARILHVTRHPLGVCYAMYKTLFEAGYPFSYDLGEIAQYYLAYRRLMAHWTAALPGAMLEVSYEQLVADLPGQARRMLAFCGLDWEEACVDFHRNDKATTTASAAQVRRPLYDTSVSQWRHYADGLQGLRAQLEAAGVECGA